MSVLNTTALPGGIERLVLGNKIGLKVGHGKVFAEKRRAKSPVSPFEVAVG
jgi:hypothetical protein